MTNPTAEMRIDILRNRVDELEKALQALVAIADNCQDIQYQRKEIDDARTLLSSVRTVGGGT